MFLESGSKQTIEDILNHREQRSITQKKFLSKDLNSVLISFSLNIPGQIKNNRYITEVFINGCEEIKKVLKANNIKIILEKNIKEQCGLDLFLLVKYPREALKKMFINLEEESTIGRLYDIDVLYLEGDKIVSLSRLDLEVANRNCLLCDNYSKVCSRNRTHNLKDIEVKLDSIYFDFKRNKHLREIKMISECAQSALLQEVILSPKPGLVDAIDSGSHNDMNVFTFIESGVALGEFFEKFILAGYNEKHKDIGETLTVIQQIGIEAEKKMYQATNNVNTHKGAIFSLGVFLSICGRLEIWDVDITFSEFQNEIKKMMSNILAHFDNLNKGKNDRDYTFGEMLYLKHNIKGIRGEAKNGYPSVFEKAYPFFVSRKGSYEERLIDTLLYCSTFVEDTNLIKRSSNMNVFIENNLLVDKYFNLGGCTTKKGFDYLIELNMLYMKRNWSIGGSADILILIIFLDQLVKKKYLFSNHEPIF